MVYYYHLMEKQKSCKESEILSILNNNSLSKITCITTLLAYLGLSVKDVESVALGIYQTNDSVINFLASWMPPVIQGRSADFLFAFTACYLFNSIIQISNFENNPEYKVLSRVGTFIGVSTALITNELSQLDSTVFKFDPGDISAYIVGSFAALYIFDQSAELLHNSGLTQPIYNLLHIQSSNE